MKKLLIIIFSLFSSVIASALELPAIFSDGMVLQRGMKIPIWGTSDPKETVTVILNNQKKTAIADVTGKWKLYLDAELAGGPYDLKVISGIKSMEFHDILIGEVWLCSGQSNMEFAVKSAIHGSEEIASANYFQIRQIKIPNTISDLPKEAISRSAKWLPAIKNNVGDFTAVGYFFAKELYEKIHVPIGLINSTWGGTDVETWTSASAFEKDPEFTDMIKNVRHIDMDSFAKEKNKAILNNIIKLQGVTPTGKDEHYSELSFEDSKWPIMSLPGLWETKLLKDLDGIVWFRKKLQLSKTEASSKAVLSLSMIDDNDETYINGVKVGTTKSYNAKRLYNIPSGILVEGENVISVRVEDTGGGGGIYGDPSDMYISGNDFKKPLDGDWKYQVVSILTTGNSLNPNAFPSLLYNGMINPIIPFGIRGALWYQGENNAGRAFQYRKAFPLMINDWRSRWKEGDFPFYFVQLATYNSANGNSNNGSTWAELREAQQLTLHLPNTGMAVTTDVGDPNDIHPKNKQDVGKRLAAIALNDVYQTKMIHSGPQFKSVSGKGSLLLVYFKNTGGGLEIHNDRKLQGFEIAGADKKFYPANAVIKAEHVELSSPVVTKPVAVRYSWADDAGSSNLFNKEGFPAAPFRSDTWKSFTEKEKYSVNY